MVNILEPLFFECGMPSVAIDPAQPTVAHISFHTTRHLVSLALTRADIERLHHEIGAKLKEAPLPARTAKASISLETRNK